MLQDPLLLEPPTEEDFEAAKLLLSEHTPEQLGALLVRLYRARLPATEAIVDPGQEPARQETRAPTASGAKPSKGPRPTRLTVGATWFRLDIGRKKNADPKWLLPMLCRKGNLTRQDIGAIEIGEHETRIEIAEPVAAQFATNMRRPGGDNIRVERLNAATEHRNVKSRNKTGEQNRKPRTKHKEKSKP